MLTYADMMRRYAEVTGLGGRFIRTVPVLTPELASHWVGLVTPVLSGVARRSSAASSTTRCATRTTRSATSACPPAD